jgi:DNA-binding NtrC family response regulator
VKNDFEGVVERMLDAGIFLGQAVEVLEKGMIEGALKRSEGNQCEASKQLGIHRNTLQRKIGAYGLDHSRGRARRKPAARAARTRRRKSSAA